MRCTWRSTVRGLNPSATAISFVDNPCWSDRRTACSRGDSPSGIVTRVGVRKVSEWGLRRRHRLVHGLPGGWSDIHRPSMPDPFLHQWALGPVLGQQRTVAGGLAA